MRLFKARNLGHVLGQLGLQGRNAAALRLGSGTAFGLAFQLGEALYVAFSFRSVDRRLKLLPRKKREGPSPNDDSRGKRDQLSYHRGKAS